MQRSILIGSLLTAAVCLWRLPTAEAVRYPDPSANGFEWFYIFGPDGNAYYGAQAEKKIFQVEVPIHSGESVMINVLDADTRGRHDEMAGTWNTSTKFSVFGGSQLLASETVPVDAPDNTTLRFGPFTVSQGEQRGNWAVFRIEVEGVSGNDNNLFAFDIEPSNAQFSALNPGIRLAEHEGDQMRLYPAVPSGTTTLHASNYDLDPDGGTSFLSPPGRILRAFRLHSSGSAQWATTDIPVSSEWSGNRWTYEITKATEPRGNMAMRFEDQSGQTLPIYFRPGESRPVVHLPPPAPLAACNTFEFDASKSYDPDNQQLTYAWDFGDGATGDKIRMRHTYEKAGDYHIVLTVTDSSNAACRLSRTEQSLHVNSPPHAVCDLPMTACAGAEVHLSAAKSSDTPGDTLSYHWDLGDGTSAEGAEVTHAYAKGGQYQVRLVVDDNRGTTCSKDQSACAIRINTPPFAKANDGIVQCVRNPQEPLAVTLDASPSGDADNNKLSFHWDFGDGTAAEGAKVKHIYQRGGHYTAKVLVDDGSGTGCSTATANVPITLNHAPIVAANRDVTTCAGATVAFDASASSDPDGDTIAYTWDFGDGTTATGAKVEHRYEQGGAYHVTVKADDGSGLECAISTASLTARVNTAPRAMAKVEDAGCAGQELVFDASGSSDADGQRLHFRWDFGDGTTAEGAKVQHAFQKGGSYPIKLSVDDGSGTPCSLALAQGQVRINTPPVASAGPNLVCCREDVNQFDASKSYDPDGDALTYRWDFGDGTTAEGMKVQHAYEKNGSFPIRVTVSDNSGIACGTSTAGFAANVNAPPVAAMAIRGDTGRVLSATAGEQPDKK